MFYIAKTGGFEGLLGALPQQTVARFTAASQSNSCPQSLKVLAREYLDAVEGKVLLGDSTLVALANRALLELVGQPAGAGPSLAIAA